MTPPLWCQTHQHLSRWSSWQKCLWAAQPTGALPAPLLGWGGDIPRRLEWRFGNQCGLPCPSYHFGEAEFTSQDTQLQIVEIVTGPSMMDEIEELLSNPMLKMPGDSSTCNSPRRQPLADLPDPMASKEENSFNAGRGTPGLCEAATSIFSWVFTGENSQHHGPFQPLPLTWYSGEGNQPYSLPVTGQLHQPIRWCIAPPRGNEWCNGSSTLCQGHNRQAPSADHIRNRSWSLQKLNWHFWGYQRSKGLVCHCDWKCRGCLWDCQEATKILTPSEESFLNAFMKALYKINPSLHNKLSCMKRVDIPYLDIGMGCIFKC